MPDLKVGSTADASPANEGSSNAPSPSTADVPPEVAAIRQDFSAGLDAAPVGDATPARSPETSSASARTTDAPSYGEAAPAAERSSGSYGEAAPKPAGDGGSSEG